MRLAVLVLFTSIAFAQSDVDAELTKAARSPYDLARFIDSHVTFGWSPLWSALGMKTPMTIHRCGTDGGPHRDCNEELITVLDPFQVIVRIYQDVPFMDTYLRFLRPSGLQGTGPWIFGGAYEGLQKDYEPRHEIRRIGSRPFLLVRHQGISGSDWSSEIESWFDLTLSAFEPVFDLTKKYSYSGVPDRVALTVSTFMVGLEAAPFEQIHVACNARFNASGPLTESMYDAVYSRRGNRFVFDAERSKSAKSDVAAFCEFDGDDAFGPSDQEFLRVLLPTLRKIASGPKDEQRDWLKRFVSQADNSPEKRELQVLLKSAR